MSQPRRIAFLDRDGVINQNAPEHEYITSVNAFIFNPGIFDVMRQLAEAGYEFIILTNQRGIARRMVTAGTVDEIHAHMQTELSRRGITILDIFVCPHESNTCSCRKPLPGLLEQACARYTIDLTRSLFITDSEAEVAMGTKFGLARTILVPKDHPEAALGQLSL